MAVPPSGENRLTASIISSSRNPFFRKSFMTKKPRESQYQVILDKIADQGVESVGAMTNQAWDDDPKRLVFTFARYKFVAKMFSGRRHVLEVGCADAFATRIVHQEVGELTAVDFDPVFIDDVIARMREKWKITTF